MWPEPGDGALSGSDGRACDTGACDTGACVTASGVPGGNALSCDDSANPCGCPDATWISARGFPGLPTTVSRTFDAIPVGLVRAGNVTLMGSA